MGHAGRLTRNCKLDRKGSSAAIRVTLLYTLCHDGCWAFAALNNQNRIRSAVDRSFPPFEIQCYLFSGCRETGLPTLDIYRAFREFLEYFGNIYVCELTKEDEREFGKFRCRGKIYQREYTWENYYYTASSAIFWMLRMNMWSVAKILQKFNFFLVFHNFFFIFSMKLCDNGLCIMIWLCFFF